MYQKAPAEIDNPLIDKQGAALDRQRFRMLQDIAQELSGEMVFPTSFDAVMRLRQGLDDPNIGMDRVVALIQLDPLISARVIALANSAFYNRGVGEIRDLRRAIERVGLQVVRTSALAIALKQLLLARHVVAFQKQADQLWAHSLRSASAAYVIAKRLSRVNPDEAMLAGLIHDVGAFYMMYRASQYEELVLRPESTRYLVIRWHEAVGHSLAVALGIPEPVADAILYHDQPRPFPERPRTLADVVYAANLLAGGKFEWLDLAPDSSAEDLAKLAAMAAELGAEIDAHEASIKDAFA